MLLLLAAVATGVVAYVVIYRRRKRQAQSPAEKLQHKRGGRPRAPTKGPKKQPAQPTKSRRPKPEIICWKRERQWVPAVEVPEYLLGKSGLVVLQNTSPLTQDESSEGCWRLEQACGKVVVHWNEDEAASETTIALGEDNYLLFKLSGQNQNQGCRVKSPSSGSYLVIVSERWERDDTLSGPPPVAPESVSITGYQAHFFILEKDGDRRIAFRTPGGNPVVIKSKASRFELVGTRLNDANREVGPLFAEGPPQIRALDDQAWKDVGTIVVSEEGSGKQRWRTQFNPDPERMEQDLPPEVAAKKGGWYFLRVYDTNGDLVESLDFRFMNTLKGITVLRSSPLPSEGGHKPVRVEFLHEPMCTVQPADSLACSIQIEREDNKTILTIPPDPTCDETCWLVGPRGGPQVEVTILVERLWWAVGKEDYAPSEWEDQLLSLSRDDFTATSIKALWLRLPRRRWIDEVFVGFQQARLRPYLVKVTEKTVAIPLRYFGDAQELQNVGIASLDLLICPQGTTYTGTLCKLIVKAGCRVCDFLASTEKDIFCHVESFHLDEFFSPLTYEEMRRLNPSLPLEIYKCSYCDFYVASDDPVNPTSTICNHIEGSHPRRKVTFRVISSVDEIRKNVISALPRIHKCNLCGTHIEEAIPSDKMQHLIEHHENMLYEFR